MLSRYEVLATLVQTENIWKFAINFLAIIYPQYNKDCIFAVTAQHFSSTVIN